MMENAEQNYSLWVKNRNNVIDTSVGPERVVWTTNVNDGVVN